MMVLLLLLMVRRRGRLVEDDPGVDRGRRCDGGGRVRDHGRVTEPNAAGPAEPPAEQRALLPATGGRRQR